MYQKGSYNAKTFLCGKEYFAIEEIEVFQLMDEKEIETEEKKRINYEKQKIIESEIEERIRKEEIERKNKLKNSKINNKAKIIPGLEKSFLPSNEMRILENFLQQKKVCKTNKSYFQKLYVASQNGFHASNFHSLCDGKKKILVIIKANGYYFGGYTSSGWSQSNGKIYTYFYLFLFIFCFYLFLFFYFILLFIFFRIICF
jgi:hypothetical protein